MDEAEYRKLRRQIDEDYAQNVEALDRVWRLANKSAEPPTVTAAVSRRSGRGEILNAIRAELPSFTEPFTWKAVRERLARSRPDLPANRTTISQVLRKLWENDEVNEVEAGRGKLPAYYAPLGFAPPFVEASATSEQIETLKALCLQTGLSVADFKAKFFTPQGIEKAAEMTQRAAGAMIDDIRHELNCIKQHTKVAAK